MRYFKPRDQPRSPEEAEELRRHFERNADRYAEADTLSQEATDEAVARMATAHYPDPYDALDFFIAFADIEDFEGDRIFIGLPTKDKE